MNIVRISIPLEVAAKSLFKDTVGNDLGKSKHCKIVNIFDSDLFVSSGKAKITSKNRKR